MNSACVGIVLAGGQSSRMGTDKAQLKRGEQTMLAFSRDVLRDAGIDKVYISANRGEGIRDVYAKRGPLGGIYSVLNQIDAAAAVIVPVDMPLLRAADLSGLMDYGRQWQCPVCYEDNFLPLYLPLSPELMSYLKQQLVNDGNLKVKALIKQFGGHFIAHNEPSALHNTNTPQQWQQSLIQI